MRCLPVITYHQVSHLPQDITEEQFQEHMEYLAEHGYRTVFLADWIAGRVEPDARTLAITFDDGYLDNWVYAWPILRRYSLKATMFVCTERPKDSAPVRPNLDDVWAGRCRRSELPADISLYEANRRCILRQGGCDDFINWNELRQMQGTGLVDVQSHSQYHRSCFIAEQILDFNQNQEEYFDLAWATDGDARIGIPVYPRRSAVAARRYFDDPGLRDHLARRVGGPEFFAGRQRAEYLRELHACAADYRRTHPRQDRYETEEQCTKRIEEELSASRKTIEQKLGKPCELICWPWGQYDRRSLQLAERVGFKGAVAFTPGRNIKGTRSGIWQIRRFPAPGDVPGLLRCLEVYGSPVRATLAEWRKNTAYLWDRARQRARDGALWGTIRRRVFGQ